MVSWVIFDANYNIFLLFQVIDRYYSRTGLPAAKGSRDFKDKISACQRYKNYETWVNTDGINTRLKQEAKYFALEYKRAIVSPINDLALDNAINLAVEEMEKEITLLGKD